MEVALPFFLVFHSPHSFRGQFICIPVLEAQLDIVQSVHYGCLKTGLRHLFIVLFRPDGGFSSPVEEVQAVPSLNTISLRPEYLLYNLDVAHVT